MDSGTGDSAENMAIDEALLEGAKAIGKPVLRFYGWAVPAATFGYSQCYAAVAKLTLLRPLIRRPTGGGLVPHDRDWTYSVVFPTGHLWFALKAVESYQRMHWWIQAAFAQLGVATELAPNKKPDAPGQCFVGAEKNDVLWLGSKIAGAAQRRTRAGLLIQGSVQPPLISLQRTAWQKAMCDVASTKWNVDWAPAENTGSILIRACALTLEKYAQDRFYQKR